MSEMTQVSQVSLKTANRKKDFCGICKSILASFQLNGHFNFAFIYGSWEVVRARKVGTTHTKVDYVIYRLFYPVLLIGACLFAVVAETNLGNFFCLLEVWSMILQITYSFIFLQNVLSNNLHREPVRGRQRIPERLVVTDEIEKGGHKFYICKRYSILPTENLYYTEQLIWLIFNMLASVNVAMFIGHTLDIIQLGYPHSDHLERIRSTSMALLIVADVFLTPIPIRIAHIIYPVCYCLVYATFLYILFLTNGKTLYRKIDFKGKSQTFNAICIRIASVALVHCLLCLFSKLRDYIISILDDSKTAKKLQNLRSQKRLARRKLMNYVEGPDGRIIGISLEKHTHAVTVDEIIRTEKEHRGPRSSLDSEGGGPRGYDDDDDSDEDVRGKGQDKADSYDLEEVASMVPFSTEVKPMPPPRYDTTHLDPALAFSSSSSSVESLANTALHSDDDELRLPSPPKKDSKVKPRPSKIPRPLHKLGLQLKPRDSKEQIHHKMSVDRQYESPPTPPFISLVTTMLKVQLEKKKKELELQENRKLINNRNRDPTKLTVVRVGRRGPQQGWRRQETGPGGSNWRRLSANIGPRFEDEGSELITGKPTSPMLTLSPPDHKWMDDIARAEHEFGKSAIKQPPNVPKVAAKIISAPVPATQAPERKEVSPKAQKTDEFNSELTKKLESERDKREGMGDVPGPAARPRDHHPHGHRKRSAGSDGSRRRRRHRRHSKERGILKHGGGEVRASKVYKRSVKLAKRRIEKTQGKQGHPVYDPLVVPKTEHDTSFHFLGTRLKGEKVEKTALNPEDLPFYRSHPGLKTQEDDTELAEGGQIVAARRVSGEKSLVTFHPVVRYFDVNEVAQPENPKQKSVLKKN